MFSSRRSQLGALIALWAFSSFQCSHYLFSSGSLYLDHLRLYSYSYDNLHALNWFGEPAWWFPHNQGGIAGYVYSQLGVVNAGTPLSAVLGGALWLLGRLGIHVANLHAVYVVHHFWVLPGVFLLGVWLCARIVLRHGAAVVFVLVIAAFSPPILQNLKDPGFLEITAYGLYFAAAWLHLLRAPDRPAAFWALVLAACALAVSIGFAFLTWDLYFAALIVAVPLALYPPARRGARRLLAAVPARRWLLAGAVVALCAVPKLVMLHQRGDLVRTNVVQEGYRFDQFRPGNPWQVMLSGVPALGFGNTSVDQYPVGFIAMPTPFFFHSSYLGVLALPLAVLGLVFGRPALRLAVLGLASTGLGVILLSANSPLFAPLLLPESPLRSVNHYFDIYYGFGGSLLVVFAAGFGLDRLATDPRQGRRLLALYGAALALSIAVFCGMFSSSLTILGSFFGFYVLTAGLIAIALAWIIRARSAAVRRQACLALLCLAALDVSTVAWHYLKANLATIRPAALDEPREDHVGLTSPDANSCADACFESRTLRELVSGQHLDFGHLPATALTARAHVQAQPSQADVDQIAGPIADGAPGAAVSLALASDAPARDRRIRAFLAAGPDAAPPVGRVVQTRLTYRTLELASDAAAAALVFLRVPYSLYWRAEVDGEPARLVRALGYYSALVVPAGHHAIRLVYSPTGVGATLMMAWLILAGVAVIAVVLARRDARRRRS